MKRCALCQEEKELTEFSTAGSSTKRHARCKPCRSRKQSETARRNPAAIAARNRRYRAQPEKAARIRANVKRWCDSNPEKALLRGARRRAKESGMMSDIELSDIKIPHTCPVLGIELRRGSGRLTANSPTVDRIDSTRGYVKGNVAVISWRANSLKKDGTLAELRALVRWLETQ